MPACRIDDCTAVDQLEGFTIGVTADRRAEEQAELLRRRGADVMVGATVRTENWADEGAILHATRRVIAEPPDVLVASTGIGMRGWLAFAETQGLDRELLATLGKTRIIARGPKAAGAVSQAGLPLAATEPTEQLAYLAADLLRRGVRGLVVAIQLYGAATSIVATLEKAGAEVIAVPVYRWTFPADEEPAGRLVRAALEGRLEAITFTSPPALEHLFTFADRDGHGDQLRSAFNNNVICACVGPVTAETARTSGVNNPIHPERGRLGLMVRTLAELLHRRHRHLVSGHAEVVIQGCLVRAGSRQVTLSRR
ncbi:MAG TPA: uroporphyrinogen-III synthase, partial [Acidimicrobiales bacterium]|nr:uroporphyrinogen-III synthase [Acidimicrobiales bacterium]